MMVLGTDDPASPFRSHAPVPVANRRRRPNHGYSKRAPSESRTNLRVLELPDRIASEKVGATQPGSGIGASHSLFVCVNRSSEHSDPAQGDKGGGGAAWRR
jgi:hypothetical protein